MSRTVAVIDIGKTNVKVALVNLDTASEIAVTKTPNTVIASGPYPHYDVEAIWTFIRGGLTSLARDHHVDAVVVTTHGATAALIDGHGDLALPVMDYEFTGLDEARAAYEPLRPTFAVTGSPPLPVGLNLAAQIYWQSKKCADEFVNCKSILTYPQYWACRLSGIKASEATSLGCHTDLWNPWTGEFSSLVLSQGWQSLFPPVQLANANLGPILPQIAAECGIEQGTPVFCGIHDSNASLLPYLGHDMASFSVVSTGTWIISLSVGGQKVELDPTQDTLVNVNANGEPTPTARFMGGREFDLLTGGASEAPDETTIDAVLAKHIMVVPDGASFAYPNGEPVNAGERQCVAAFYCALRTAHCLDLIGAKGPIFIEGPFAKNTLYLQMLTAVTKRDVCPNNAGSTGTSLGAALLADDHKSPVNQVGAPAPLKTEHNAREALMHGYADQWRRKYL
jgi:sugar (pentulose or hexulose) kinase